MNNNFSLLNSKTKSRQSNIELLRIIATFLVLIVHADFFSFGRPNPDTYASSHLFSLGQYFFQSLSIGCVNMFILISGWFGIHPKMKSFSNFIFQCAFFLFGIFFVFLVIGKIDFTSEGIFKGLAGCFLLLKSNWFIKSYILLYLMSPILNSYIEQTCRKDLRNFLILFFSFQTLYAWATGAVLFFMEGYSTISFIGLYILARYVHLYPSRFTSLKGKYYLYIFFLCVVLITIISYFSLGLASSYYPTLLGIVSRMYSYINPLVILMSLSLLLFFSKLSFKNRFINFLGNSSFAVFLLHTNPNLCEPYFVKHINFLNDSYDSFVFIILTFLYLVLVFILAVLIDQIRIRFWNFFLFKLDILKK